MKNQIFLLAIFLLNGLAAFTPFNADNHTVTKKEGVKSLANLPAFLGRYDLVGGRPSSTLAFFMAMVAWGVSLLPINRRLTYLVETKTYASI